MKTQKPSICFVGPMLGSHSGWVPNQGELLAAMLKKRGYHCLVTSTKLNRYLRLLDVAYTLFRYFREYNLVCIQVFSGPGFALADVASQVARILGKPIVMILRGGNTPEFMARFPKWTIHVLNRAQKLVAPSGYLAQSLQSFGLQTEIIPNLIALENYPFRLRRELRPRILWMRTFHEIYNPLMAVDVLEKLIILRPDITLTMSGQEKGLLATTQQYVIEKGLEKQVRFAGFLDDMQKKREFMEHDIFINTNRIDNMPVSVIEAAAFGIPIVATSVGGVPYLLQHEQTGLLVQNEDVQGMADAVIRLLAQPGLAEHLSSQGRIIAEQSGWQKVLPQWERLFTDMLENK